MHILRAARTKPPSEEEVRLWLVEHYSDIRKMPADRVKLLLDQRTTYPYLHPDATKLWIYRGLFNITEAAVEKIRLGTSPVRDKSWTTNVMMADRFAHGEFTDESAIEGRHAVVLKARLPHKRALLNAQATAGEPGIGDVHHDLWNEPLAVSILTEREVLVSGTVHPESVSVEQFGETVVWWMEK